MKNHSKQESKFQSLQKMNNFILRKERRYMREDTLKIHVKLAPVHPILKIDLLDVFLHKYKEKRRSASRSEVNNH